MKILYPLFLSSMDDVEAEYDTILDSLFQCICETTEESMDYIKRINRCLLILRADYPNTGASLIKQFEILREQVEAIQRIIVSNESLSTPLNTKQ